MQGARQVFVFDRSLLCSHSSQISFPIQNGGFERISQLADRVDEAKTRQNVFGNRPLVVGGGVVAPQYQCGATDITNNTAAAAATATTTPAAAATTPAAEQEIVCHCRFGFSLPIPRQSSSTTRLVHRCGELDRGNRRILARTTPNHFGIIDYLFNVVRFCDNFTPHDNPQARERRNVRHRHYMFPLHTGALSTGPNCF
jgi:hypothetical protein